LPVGAFRTAVAREWEIGGGTEDPGRPRKKQLEKSGSLENLYVLGSRFARRIEFVRSIFLEENTDQFVGSDGNNQKTARHSDYKSPAEKVGPNADQQIEHKTHPSCGQLCH
jgi:hypothetical protein